MEKALLFPGPNEIQSRIGMDLALSKDQEVDFYEKKSSPVSLSAGAGRLGASKSEGRWLL
jgi:hypothetical protein